ncbi:Magnesium-transporting ATPase, P-type 1 [Dyadobacter sp. CECT 9275]|uniref:Magnesium-transporting ATPase, P-type 1 n=1 Tax=Dyadobacter helix TaxID=2822344 RepID=A0A916NNY9_9BACT|nr:magnesium-translocating P-type ATPase [Dyadobacter sp. CECT 9275]CAG5017841.1 Magnesium-transporting ATPase, P-type 1 [Dyadobacter sp. CECT 9275]
MYVKMIRSLPLGAVFEQLGSNVNGLNEDVVRERQKQNLKKAIGDSELKKALRIFIRQFTSPLVLLLVIAVMLSAVLGEVSDTLIIFFILVITGLLSFWQEFHAGKAVEKLREMIEIKSLVVRNGVEQMVNTNEIVPGDILHLKAGDIIPADCRIVESNELHVNESSLTGESYPAEKTAGITDESAPLAKTFNCIWEGTNVVSGTATVVAVHTGNETVFGKIAASLSETHETAFERGIKQFGYFLLQITAVLTLIIFAVNIYFHKPLLDSLLFSLALAVGMAPELLPAIMTVAMSSGAARMMKKKVIVKKLSSIFNLGEVRILCSDKTGTITEGTVIAKDFVNVYGRSDEQVRLFAFLNASMQQGFTNPVDQAICAMDVGQHGYVKLGEIPYDFIRKRLSILVGFEEKATIISKGALANILEVCKFVHSQTGGLQQLEDRMRHDINDRFEGFSKEGYRVLGIASKVFGGNKMSREDETEMTFMGYLLLEDPLKESSVASIKRLGEMQVQFKVITGDNRYAAAHVAQQLGINQPQILTGDELNEMSPEALLNRALSVDVFSEIEPHQKVRIVKALQGANQVVAYIGDGINDVAAINAADAGISTNNAVDAAKQAADFVLLEKDLAVLADGIQEGRTSFVNSMKYIFITTGATFGNMFSVAAASLLLPFLPMLPKQILLTNFITDLPALAIASDNVDQQQLATPGRWNMKLIRNFMIVFGLHSSVFDFLTFYVLYFHFHLSGAAFRTGWFLESVITELLILLVIRTKLSFFKSKPGNLLLGITVFALVLAIYLPWSPFALSLGLTFVPLTQVLVLLGILTFYMITADWLKVWFFRFNKA